LFNREQIHYEKRTRQERYEDMSFSFPGLNVTGTNSSSKEVENTNQNTTKFEAPEPLSGKAYYVEVDRNMPCPDTVDRITEVSQGYKVFIELNGFFLVKLVEKVKESEPNADKEDVFKALEISDYGFNQSYISQIYNDVASQIHDLQAREAIESVERSEDKMLKSLESTFCRICKRLKFFKKISCLIFNVFFYGLTATTV
jgi:hypothetical protein